MTTTQRAANVILRTIVDNPHHKLTDAEAAVLIAAPEKPLMMQKIIALHFHNAGDFEQALDWAMKVFETERIAENAKNVSLIHRKLHRHDDGIRFALEHEALFEPIAWNDILCMLYWNKGDREGAIRHGTRSLELKDASSGKAPPLTPVVHRFDHGKRARQIISFSLFGVNPRYLTGAVQNAIVARYLYPGWAVRMYVDDSVPQEAIRALLQEGAQVRKVSSSWPAARYGLFWRFLIEDDPDVDIYIVRDTDSVMNIKERAAVEDWLASGKAFHVMRDLPSHSELILAGMWGAHRGNIGGMQKRVETVVEGQVKKLNNVTIDQVFLREQIWPIVRQDALVHDACFGFGNPVRYRDEFTLPRSMHIGQNDWVHRTRVKPPAAG